MILRLQSPLWLPPGGRADVDNWDRKAREGLGCGEKPRNTSTCACRQGPQGQEKRKSCRRSLALAEKLGPSLRDRPNSRTLPLRKQPRQPEDNGQRKPRGPCPCQKGPGSFAHAGASPG